LVLQPVVLAEPELVYVAAAQALHQAQTDILQTCQQDRAAGTTQVMVAEVVVAAAAILGAMVDIGAAAQ